MSTRRLSYASIAAVLLGLAIFEVAGKGVGLWQLLVFAAMPDIALFLGPRRRHLHPAGVAHTRRGGAERVD